MENRVNIKGLYVVFFLLISSYSYSYEKSFIKRDSLVFKQNHLFSVNILHFVYQNFVWEYHYIPKKCKVGFYFKNSIAFDKIKEDGLTRQRFRIAVGAPYTLTESRYVRLFLSPNFEYVNFYYNTIRKTYSYSYTPYGGGYYYNIDNVKIGNGLCVNLNLGFQFFTRNGFTMGIYAGAGYRFNFTPDIAPSTATHWMIPSNEYKSYPYVRGGFQLGYSF